MKQKEKLFIPHFRVIKQSMEFPTPQLVNITDTIIDQYETLQYALIYLLQNRKKSL